MPQGINRWNVAEQCRAVNQNDQRMQEKEMQRAKDCGDAKIKFGAPSSPGILVKIQGTHGWKYKTKIDKKNVPGKGHGGCDFAAGENVLCATVTRTAGKIVITCDGALPIDRMTSAIANVKAKVDRMTSDDRMARFVEANVKVKK